MLEIQDIILYVNLGEMMKLAKCPKCDKIIDVDDLEILGPETIVGCGLKEDDFEYCTDCAGRGNTKLCEEIRTDDELSFTKVEDLIEGGEIPNQR